MCGLRVLIILYIPTCLHEPRAQAIEQRRGGHVGPGRKIREQGKGLYRSPAMLSDHPLPPPFRCVPRILHSARECEARNAISITIDAARAGTARDARTKHIIEPISRSRPLPIRSRDMGRGNAINAIDASIGLLAERSSLRPRKRFSAFLATIEIEPSTSFRQCDTADPSILTNVSCRNVHIHHRTHTYISVIYESRERHNGDRLCIYYIII